MTTQETSATKLLVTQARPLVCEGEPSHTGIWLGLAAITMTFAALTSAMIVREGTASDWRHFTLPSILYINTLILIASSATLQLWRRRFARGTVSLTALYATLGLGCAFVGGQVVAWSQLRAQGFYLATSPSSSFFYVFTWMHALHVLAGLLALVVVVRRLRQHTLRLSTLDNASCYWLFMTVLWVCLFFLLRQRI